MDIAAFVKERDDALRSLDVDRVIAFHQKHNPGHTFSSREVAEAGMHKARTACLSLTDEERRFSKQWLSERGMKSLDDGNI